MKDQISQYKDPGNNKTYQISDQQTNTCNTNSKGGHQSHVKITSQGERNLAPLMSITKKQNDTLNAVAMSTILPLVLF